MVRRARSFVLFAKIVQQEKLHALICGKIVAISYWNEKEENTARAGEKFALLPIRFPCKIHLFIYFWRCFC